MAFHVMRHFCDFSCAIIAPSNENKGGAEMNDLLNLNELNESELETVSGGRILPRPTLDPDGKPSEGGATGSW